MSETSHPLTQYKLFVSDPIIADSPSGQGGADHGKVAVFIPNGSLFFIPDSAHLKVIQDTQTDFPAHNTYAIVKNTRNLRGGRVGLNSVSVPIDGFPASYLPRLPL
jgi:hypothetical protein